MRAARVMGLTLAWLLSVGLVAGAGWVAIGLAGQRIGVVAAPGVVAPVPGVSGTGVSSPGAPDTVALAAGTRDAPSDSSAGSSADPAAGTPSASPTGVPSGSPGVSGVSGSDRAAGRPTGGTTGSRAGTETATLRPLRTSSSASSSSAGPASSSSASSRRSSSRSSSAAADDDDAGSGEGGSSRGAGTGDVTWGGYEDRAGQVRLGCDGTGISDWRVLPAVGWTARAVILGSSEIWVVFVRGTAGVAVSAACQLGRPVIKPLGSTRDLERLDSSGEWGH